MQLTWMDAKVGGHVVTPRDRQAGRDQRAVVRRAADDGAFRRACDEDPFPYEMQAARVRESFDALLERGARLLLRRIDGPEGDDPAIRPNQLFAVALAPELPAPEHVRARWSTCACATC